MPHYARGWRGNGGEKRRNKNLKQNWKTLKPTKQGGLPASIRPPQNIRSDLGAWLRTCKAPHPGGNRCGVSDEAQSTRHFPRSYWTVSPCWQTRARPWGWGSGKTGRLCTIDSDELIFSSWKSQEKIHKSKSHDLLCPFRNWHQILQNGQLALNIRIPRADYRYEAWKSTSSLRGAYVRDLRPGHFSYVESWIFLKKVL